MMTVTPEATAELGFVKSTVAFVAVPGVVGFGEIACGERPEAGAGEGAGPEILPPVLGSAGRERLRLTEKDLVARPAPSRHSSKPASTSMRYHDFLM
jgi:hypothetical protein